MTQQSMCNQFGYNSYLLLTYQIIKNSRNNIFALNWVNRILTIFYMILSENNVLSNMIEKDYFSAEEIAQYLKQRVMPILEPLQIDLINHRPYNIHEYSLKWLMTYNENQKKFYEMINEDQEPDEVFREKVKKKLAKHPGFRVGVSGQCFNKNIFQQRIQTMQFDKTEQIKIKLLIQLRNSILFKNLSHQNMIQIIAVMKEIDYKAGQTVIREGQLGNQLFIIHQGQFTCHFQHKQEVRTYGSGQIFGQLALLYGTPRASTIIAATDGKVFALQRQYFNKILREQVMKKNAICQQILNKVQILKDLDSYEKSKIYENLKEIQVNAGKYIIRQGQLGDCFYIVVYGKLVAEKLENDELKSVYYYKQGDYFGEVALTRNVPRQASVKCLTKAKLAYIQRSAFKRLLGPIEHILKKKQAKYKSKQQN